MICAKLFFFVFIGRLSAIRRPLACYGLWPYAAYSIAFIEMSQQMAYGCGVFEPQAKIATGGDAYAVRHSGVGGLPPPNEKNASYMWQEKSPRWNFRGLNFKPQGLQSGHGLFCRLVIRIFTKCAGEHIFCTFGIVVTQPQHTEIIEDIGLGFLIGNLVEIEQK